MGERLRVLRAVVRNPVLRRLELAFLTFSIGEWAAWLAIVVYAYGRGGAAEAAAVAFVQLAPTVLLAPFVSLAGDRFPRARVLVASYLAQAGAMGGTALALLVDAPSPLVYLAATATTTCVTLSRPAHASLLPEVVDRPEELTAANVASGTAEGLGALAGPALAGVLVGLGGPGAVFVALSAGLLVAAAMTLSVSRRLRRRPGSDGGAHPSPGAHPADHAQPADHAHRVHPTQRSIGAELLGGVTAIRTDPQLAATVAIVSAGTILLGALDILYAVLAFDVLRLGDSGVGFLGAATGVGALVGAMSAVWLVGRDRLGGPLLLAGLVFGASLAGLGLAPNPVLAPILLGLGGAGSAIVYVAGQTLIQRLAADAVLSRVFGVLEGLMMAATAVGAISVPLLIAIAGPSGALITIGLFLPLVALALGRSVVTGDRVRLAVGPELALLRGLPMFAPLPAPELERLAGALERLSVPAGRTIIRQGDAGDRFFVIAQGFVDVAVDGRPVRREGPGEAFGEIALLREVPRTATVTAGTDVELQALDRESFLGALSGHRASRPAAERLADERLGTAEGEAGVLPG